jgi:hypothetical protein
MRVNRLAQIALGVALGACHSSAETPVERQVSHSQANDSSPSQIAPAASISALREITSRDYSSSLPPMQQLDPRVTDISVDFTE